MRSELDDIYLRPLKGKGRKEKPHAVYDIEAKDWTRPFLIGFCADGKTVKQFRDALVYDSNRPAQKYYEPGGCIDKFLRFLFGLETHCDACNAGFEPSQTALGFRHTCRGALRRYTSTFFNLYAHNGGRYDHLFMIPWLRAHDKLFSWDVVTAGGRCIIITVRWVADPRISWEFRDSVSIVPLSLKEACKTFCPEQVQKMSMDEDDFVKIDEHDPYWDQYNAVDCIANHNVITNFTKLINKLGGRVKITAPGTAVDIFRRKYLKTWIERVEHFKNSCPGKCNTKHCERLDCNGEECHGCAHEFARSAYYGGRTELFWNYGTDITYFDLNSSYAASMLERMPVGKAYEFVPARQTIDEIVRTFDTWSKTKVGIVECEVEIPESCHIPPLPYPRDGKLLFPVGKFSGVWDYEELKLLTHPQVGGRITKVRRSHWYKGEPIFREMVLALYHYRQKHINGCKNGSVCKSEACNPDYSEGLSYCAKLILNSLYGRFGMNLIRERTIIISPDDEWPKYGYCIDLKGYSVWNVQTVIKSSCSIPQIAEHVTTLSRIRLFLGMMEIVEQGKEVFYCDTDSVMSNGAMTESEDLGGWKNEEPGMLVSGDFVLPKTYRLRFHEPGCVSPITCAGCVQKHDKKCKGCTDFSCRRTKSRMKGIPRNKQTATSWTDLVEDGKQIRFPQMAQFKGIIRGNGVPVMQSAAKSIHAEFDKRRRNRDGSTRPIAIYEPGL